MDQKPTPSARLPPFRSMKASKKRVAFKKPAAYNEGRTWRGGVRQPHLPTPKVQARLRKKSRRLAHLMSGLRARTRPSTQPTQCSASRSFKGPVLAETRTMSASSSGLQAASAAESSCTSKNDDGPRDAARASNADVHRQEN